MSRRSIASLCWLIITYIMTTSGGDAVRAQTATGSPTTAPGSPAHLMDAPTAGEQAKAQKLIEEVYGPYPPAGATPKRKLARLLLARAEQTSDDTVARFVLLRDAIDLAYNCGDHETEGLGILEMSRWYLLGDALSRRLTDLRSEHAFAEDAADWGRAEALPKIVDTPVTVGGPGVRLQADVTCTIDKGGALKILPGTILHFEENAGLLVFGGLDVSADDAHPVVFAPADPTIRWQGIELKDRPACRLSGCVIQSAKSGLMLNVQKTVVVKSCAFVSDMVGISIVNAGLEISDSIILKAGRDGVDAGQDQHSKWTNVTIKDSSGAGYKGTFKGWPIMSRCTITANLNGGLTCMRGGLKYRGRPEISDSNVFGNGVFDIECNQREDYEFSDVYVGSDAGKALAHDPAALLSNIRDGRTNQKKGIGKVIIYNTPTAPVANAGASESMLRLAQSYVHDASN
jgi:hypothetical protein